VFRKQLGALLARIKSVEAAGAKVELEQVAGVLKENVEESREQVVKAEDPEERERAVEKLQRDAAALGRVEAAQEITSARPVTGSVGELGFLIGKLALDDRVTKYDARVRSAAARLRRPPLSSEQQSRLNTDVVSHFMKDASEGIPVEETIARLGPPEGFVDAWIEEHGETREPHSR
jgi:hypothetical protein